jgi:hypothetical protein
MEARLLRICVIAAFENIRFDSNAIAPLHHHTYDNLIHPWNQPFLGASV